MRIHGRRIRPPRHEPSLMPLATLGIPPLLVDSRPKELALREGNVPRAFQGLLFGDASGVGRARQLPEVVTWAVATLKADGESPGHRVCGTCTGWYPSVPRGELQALVEALEVACIPAVYAGDCQYVIDGFSGGVPRSLASSSSPHADLWRRARWLQNDHGEGITVVKVKAHRSRARAEQDEASGGLELWHGNQHADATAKGLALRLWEGLRSRAEAIDARSADFVATMTRLGICTRIAQLSLDSLKLPRVSRRRKRSSIAAGRCGGHQLVPRAAGGGHWCTRCKLITRTASSLKSLAAKPCHGEVLLGVHSSHQLRWSLGITWCERCGCYMTRLPRALRQACDGAPRSAAARNVLRRLRSGLPPTTAAYLCRTAAEDDWVNGCDSIWEARAAGPGVRARAQPAGNENDPSTQRAGRSGGEADNLRGAEAVRRGASVEVPRRAIGERHILHRDERGPRGLDAPRSSPQLRDPLPRRRDVSRGALVPRPCDGARRVDDDVCGPPHAPRPPHASNEVYDRGRVSPRESQCVPVGRQSLNDGSSATSHAAPVSFPCRPTAGGSWTRRLAPAATFVRRECGGCQSLTASRCRSCRGPLCLVCARAFKACPAAPGDQPSGGEAMDGDDAGEGAGVAASVRAPAGVFRDVFNRRHDRVKSPLAARPVCSAAPASADGPTAASRSDAMRAGSAPPRSEAATLVALPRADAAAPRRRAGADHPSVASDPGRNDDNDFPCRHSSGGAALISVSTSSTVVVPVVTTSSDDAVALPCRLPTCSVARAAASAPADYLGRCHSGAT